MELIFERRGMQVIAPKKVFWTNFCLIFDATNQGWKQNISKIPMAMEKETLRTMDSTIMVLDFRTHVQEIAEQLKIVLIYPVKDMVPESESHIQFQGMQQLDRTM